MPAHSNTFPWPSYYGHYNFFEQRLRDHNKIKTWSKVGTSLYEVILHDGRTLKVFICDCYAFGGAEYNEVIEKVGRVDAVVISSTWCGYSLDLKVACIDEQVGIFDIKGFMAALNLRQYWRYMTEHERERLET